MIFRRPWFAVVLAGALLPAPALARQTVPQSAAQPSPPDQLAERQAQLAEAEAKYPPDSPEVVQALLNLVQRQTIVRKIGPETLAYAERAVAAAEATKGKESILYAAAIAELAKLYTARDEAEKGRPLAEQALDIAQRVAPGTQEMAEVADALDKVCWDLHDWPCALHAAETAVATIRAAHVENELYLASMLQDLAQIRLFMNDHEGARSAVVESLEIVKRQPRPAPTMAVLESNAGAFYVRENQPDEGLVHLKSSLDLSNQIYGPDSIQVGYAVCNLAELYGRAGKYDDAQSQYQSCLALYRRWYGPAHSRTANVQEAYALMLASFGVLPRALDMALESHRSKREIFSLAMRVLPERQALVMSDGYMHSGLDLSLSILAQHPNLGLEAAYQEEIRTRALVAEEMAKRQASLNRGKDPEIATLLAQLDKERAAVLAATGVAPGASASAQTTADATVRMERIERQLAERSLQFRDDQRVRSVALDDVRRNLSANSVLVSYVQFNRRAVASGKLDLHSTGAYLAFVLRAGSSRIRLFDLGDSESIDKLVQRCRAAADEEAHSGGLGSTRNERAWREGGLALRRRIWDPLQSEIGDARLVLVVPDGNLNLVPFGGLPSGKGYLVEHGPVIHLLTSERDLVPTSDTARKTGLFAIGSPRFDLASAATSTPDASLLRDAPVSCDAFRSLQFSPLPGSAAEVSDIRSEWRRWNHDEVSSLVVGADATRDRFLEESSRHRVLHVATHAFLLDKSCGNGNPLLHSGLVFAGANQGRESAILTAQQIASLDLSGVDWAVLSGCNTGNGVLQDGEGVLGLQRAFRVAGAHSVIMTLWPIDDNVTRQFMRELYAQRLGQRATTADAVWNSSRRLLLARRASGKSTHPWYWAGFVGSGAWN